MQKFVLFLTILLGLVMPSGVWAQEEVLPAKTAKPAEVKKDFFQSGDRVEVKGTVNGDVYVVGREVIVSGVVEGDVFAVGETVTVSGKVNQSVRAMGGNVVISGTVGRNVTVAGEKVTIWQGASVAGNMIAAGNSVSIEAPVQGDVKVGANNLVVADAIGGNLESAVNKLELTDGARVGGDVTYWSKQAATIDSGAKITGKVVQKGELGFEKDLSRSGASLENAGRKIAGFGRLLSFLSLLILGGIMVKWTPTYAKRGVEILTKKTWKAVWVGILTLVVTPILAILLLVTLLGIPLGLIAIALYAFAIYMAPLWGVLWGGMTIGKLLKKELSLGWALVLGMVVYTIVASLPIIGGLVQFAAVILGVGIWLLVKREIYLLARGKAIL